MRVNTECGTECRQAAFAHWTRFRKWITPVLRLKAELLQHGFRDFEIAVRDLAPGDELTDDYGSLNLACSFDCRCGEQSCRRQIGADDLERFGREWDRQVEDAFRHIRLVPQPLWPLVKEAREVEDVLAGRVSMASCMLHLHKPHGLPTPIRMAAQRA